MSFIRPATPGFLINLIATILLAVVSFSVPLIKSVYFLKASLAVQGTNGYITFGTLGYCSDISGTLSCSNATVGYEFNVNALVGDNTSIQIPTVVVKWLTYALVLHIVAFGLAGVATIFGLLAHVREMAMTCFSSCISGFAATVALAAFIFDLAIFFIAKSRMNSVSGGSASIGNAVWLTLVAWILLFFSGCFYGVGRCCIKRRPKGAWGNNDRMGGNAHAEQMRLDAVKAEADRKARQHQGEIGLPSFHEYDPSQPLKARVSGEDVFLDEEDGVPYRDNQSVSTAGRAGMGSHGRLPSRNGYAGGGYVQAPRGTRAVDEYNNSSPYAAPPHRKSSTLTQTTSSSIYPPSSTTHSMSPLTSYVPSGVAATAPVHNAAGAYYSDPYSPQAYGHVEGVSSRTPPQQHAVYNPWEPQQTPSFNADTYNATGVVAAASYAGAYNPQPHQPEQSYGASTTSVPQPSDPYYTSNYQSPTNAPRSPPPPNTSAYAAPSNTSAVKGPRGPPTPVVMSPPQMYNDNPPTYEDGPSRAPVQWKS
ncbi:pali-domain-containing protein [Suillus clintonianus]|uniref:pali-domain-containing protein n=1 Tax=Suillus clintonianus TaxID=1904413 RepID=UPI001B8849C6|nr:pali-domain-containing protein [Suillus clintonianus]KAG2154593.1 pali-domain-containing protein [Suillus clintonianus]